jgi:phosphatidylglycerophosphate synthase
VLKPAVPDRVADPISAVSSFNVPNFLTTVRIVVVPILAWLLFKEKFKYNNLWCVYQRKGYFLSFKNI